MVDGLSQIPKEDVRFVEQIVRDVLPLGVEPFRFVISGYYETFKGYLRKAKAKTFQAIRLTTAESDRLLSDVCGEVGSRAQLEKLCQGNPGRLWSVRRLLSSGVTPEEILGSEPSKYLEFIKLEFSGIDQLTEPKKSVLAVLAFGRQELAIADLARICGVGELDVRSVIEDCIFLRVNDLTAAVEFTSEAHRQFAARKLETLRSRAISLQIDSLLADPNSAVAVRLLPSYYQQMNNLRAIVQLLSPEHYQRLLEVTQSLAALRLRAGLGARSAEELKETASIFQFALQRSIFSAVGEMGQDSSEVSALVALGQPQRALDIAAQATAREARLSMLAAYGRKVIERGGVLDLQTRNYIRETADQINFSELGDQAGEIASNLVFIDPDLAFAIVDASTKDEKPGVGKDAAYVRLSVTAALGNASNIASVDEKAKQRISDKTIQLMLSSLSLVAARFTFEEVKSIAEKMEAGRRIYFLRTLSVAGKKRPGVLDVIEYALDQIVGEIEYSPKPADFADLAAPLAFAADQTERVLRIAKRIESQLALVGKATTSRDSVNLQMRLAHAEIVSGVDGARDRVAESYYEVASIGNLEIRVDCLALMLSALATFDSGGLLEERDGFKSVITKDLKDGLDELLAATASHFEVAKGALKAIARVSHRDAFDLVQRMNMEDRRNRGYAEIMAVICGEEHAVELERPVFDACHLISTPEERDEAILTAIRAAARKDGGLGWLPSMMRLRDLASSSEVACETALLLLRTADECGRDDLVVVLRDSLSKSIEGVDSPLEQVTTRFSAVSSLARSASESAIEFYESAVAQRTSLSIASHGALEIVLYCLSLVSRAYRPLAHFALLSEDLLTRFARLVDFIPGAVPKASVYGELVCRIWAEGKSELAAQVALEHCVPLLEQVDSQNRSLLADLSYTLFSPLYYTHRALALSLLPRLSYEQRENVCYSAARMMLRKAAPSETSSAGDEDMPPISHADALEVIEILKLMSRDSGFYLILASLVRAVVRPENKFKFSGQQRMDVASRLRVLSSEKLPDSRNIAHEGYAIAAEAQIGRLHDAKGSYWSDLVARANKIPNIADKALVLLEMSECIPTKHAVLRKESLEAALRHISSIPSAYDRFGRLEYYMQIVRKYDIAAAKTALKDAVQLTFEMPQRDEASRCQRNLVDLADTIEPGLAEKMAEMVDDDPARRAAKAELKRLGQVQRLRRQLSKPKVKIEEEALSVRNLPSAAWKNVGALVSGRLEPLSPHGLTTYVSASGGFALEDAFPVLAWYIENCARRFNNASSAAQHMEPLAEALLVSTEIGVNVISHVQAKKLRALPRVEEGPKGLVVGPDDRVKAIEFVRSWLREKASERIVFCDPYFSSSDVEFLRLVLAECPNCQVKIIASKAIEKFKPDAFQRNWRASIDQDPPDTEVFLVSADEDAGVLHDRWIISDTEGLRLGTSFGSLGMGKLSEVSVLEAERRESVSSQLSKYLSKDRFVDGKRVHYATFSI